MKKVVSVSLGDRDLDMRFRTRFLGETFQVTRIGTDGDAKRALTLLEKLVQAVPGNLIALRALGNLQTGQLPKEMASSGIAGGSVMALFSSHPSIENRIAALEGKSRD